MNDRDQRRYDVLTRVQTFGSENNADFAAGSKATTHFTNINEVVRQLDTAKAGQSKGRASKETLVHALTIDLQNIARTARVIEQKENGLSAPYRLPDNPSESAITTHTDSVLLRLEDQANDSAAVKSSKAALRARFSAYELSADFVANLRADRTALADANKKKQAASQGSVENTGLIGQLLGQGNSEVQALNAIMHNKYTRQPEKLRAWKSVTHLERAPQREKKSASTASAPSAKAA